MKKIIALILLLLSFGVHAWPTREITLVVPYPPGGVNDQLARFMQPDLESILKVPVQIKNMPGAANAVAISYVLGKDNDNHTFVISMDDFVLGPLYQDTRSYNKFQATNVIGTVPYVLFGNDKATTAKFKQQMADRQTVNVANNGANGGAHLWISNLKSPLTINSIYYKGSAPVLTDVAAGHSEYGVSSLSASYRFVQSGKLQPIMQSGLTRSALYPRVPTAHELGFAGPDAHTWFAVLARKDTAPVALDRFGETVKLIVANNPKIQEFKSTGMTIVNYSGNKATRFFNQEIVQYENQQVKQ